MRKKFDKEFKQKAVELSYARGNASEIADELGIETWYNKRGRHSALEYKTINEFEQLNNNQKIAA